MQNSTLKKIHRYLIGKNINRTTLSYRYLVDAIWIMTEGGNKESSSTMDIYQKVAEMNCTNIYCVERDIRNSIRGMDQTCKQVIYQAVEDIELMEE